MADEDQNNIRNRKEAVAIARLFEKKFRDPKDSNKLKSGLKPSDLFEGLGFKKINFLDLEPGLQKALKKQDSERWYGHPVGFDGRVNYSDLTIMEKKDGSVLYFFRGKKDDAGNMTFACSRLYRLDNIYCVEQLHHSFNIGEIISAVSYQEIMINETMTGRHCGLKYIEIQL